jgi:DNA adenine methylase
MSIVLKCPLSYYGGKVLMLGKILPLIPPHKIYVEPFTGGAAVFFAKEKSEKELINDLNGAIVKFYRALQSDFGILRKLIVETPVSRKVHRETAYIVKNAEHFNDIKVAWAVWVQCNMGFASQMLSGYGFAKTPQLEKKIVNKKLRFNKTLKQRLDYVDIECMDAIKLIKLRDNEDAFIYADPPYFNSDCGHYTGYTAKDFEDLLTTLSSVKGKFLLSSYDSDLLQSFVEKHGWYQQKIVKKIAVTKHTSREKTEVLTANYPI